MNGNTKDVGGGMLGKLLGATGKIPYAYLAIGQGAYYFLSGLWPLVDIVSFQSATGPKTDLWLVKTVALLLMVIGTVLFTAGIRWRVTLEIFLLGAGSSLALTLIEVVYVVNGQISAIYLLDSLVEIAIAAWWLSIYVRGFSSPEVCSLFDPTFPRAAGHGERE